MGLSKLKDKLYSKLNASNSPQANTDSPEIQTSGSHRVFSKLFSSELQPAPDHAPSPAASTVYTPQFPPADDDQKSEVAPQASTVTPSTSNKPLTPAEQRLENVLGVSDAEKQNAKTAEERRKYVREYLRTDRDRARWRMY
ncbi:hypothetical protein CC78DRAFT_535662 [Lojkania enalia]|uniref:Uncharacterized protein n=1 Tax=Lojkania enalia TaxID=147567 RepID=A0A9P4K2M6_9PLEO|nr:hypothetical protein CC78DRAFT_535662 [Didymosphaeria enalia]